MNRKQVGVFLKIMMKDKTRPALECGYIDKLNGKHVIVATDGYVLTAVYLDDLSEDYIGKKVTRASIEKWYKLADGRSRFTAETIQELMEDDVREVRQVEGNYPDWQKLIPVTADVNQFISDMTIAFNADFVKLAQDLSGQPNIKLKLYGKLSPLVAESDTGITLIMPIKA